MGPHGINQRLYELSRVFTYDFEGALLKIGDGFEAVNIILDDLESSQIPELEVSFDDIIKEMKK